MTTKTKFKETDIGLIPKDWELATVSNITKRVVVGFVGVCSKFYCDKKNGMPMIRTTNLTKNGINYNNLKYIAKNFHEKNAKSQLHKNDILVARFGKSGLACLFEKDFEANCLNVVIISPDESKCLPKFLLYCFNSKIIQHQTSASLVGTIMDILNTKTIMKFFIPLPTIDEQQSIAKILSDLDSKIQLNQNTAKTLEEIGKAIFKHWFIDFEFPNEKGKPYRSCGGEMVYNDELGKDLPKGWTINESNSIIKLMMGLSPKGESYNVAEEGVPLINGAADFRGNIITPKKFTTQPTRVCKKGDLLFCIRGTIGNLTYSDKEYCLGRGTAAITVKNEIYKEYVYFILNRRLNELISKAAGSVIMGLSKPDILGFEDNPST